jgi:hypothetical protein
MYSTDLEYRQAVRDYFIMDVKALEKEYTDLKENDPISYDELLYDEIAMKNGMARLYTNTKDNDKFRELYKLAAGKFFSEYLEIGLCVLLSYDYFADFIKLYDNPTHDILFDNLSKKLL